MDAIHKCGKTSLGFPYKGFLGKKGFPKREDILYIILDVNTQYIINGVL
jgi:hypothetical protein